MKNVLILLGTRELHKRAALFFEFLIASGHKPTFLSLPRQHWNKSAYESDSSFFKTGLLSMRLKHIKAGFIPDVVLCCHWSLLPVAAALKYCFGSAILYDEYDYHNIMIEELGTPVQRFASTATVDLCRKKFVPYCDLVTCIVMKDDSLYMNLRELNHNVLGLNNYPTRKWRKDPDIGAHSSNGFAFVYSGGIFERKGCKLAAEAFLKVSGRLDGAELHFFGHKGDRELINRLRHTKEIFVHWEWPARDIINFFQSRPAVGLMMYQDYDYYRQAGTNSRKMYEYLASGVPIISTKVGDMAKFIMDREVGYLLDAGASADQLADLMVHIADNTRERDIKAVKSAELLDQNGMWWEYEWEKVMNSGIFDDFNGRGASVRVGSRT